MNEWISVEDELPSKPTRGSILVLACGQTRTISNILQDATFHKCVYDPISEDWLLFGNYFRVLPYVENVTHWMPLPEPPDNHARGE